VWIARYGCHCFRSKWLAAQHLRGFFLPIVLFGLLAMVADGFHRSLPVRFTLF
jgi:hypothetical protein